MYPRVSMLMNTAELCAVFIVRRGLAWSTSRSLSLLLFLFLGFFRTVKRGEVYSPAEKILLLSSESIFECIHGSPSS